MARPCFATRAAGGQPMALLSFAAPQVAKGLLGTTHPPYYTSGLVGAAILVAADILVRAGFGEGRVAAGSLVLVVGGLYLLWILGRRGGLRA